MADRRLRVFISSKMEELSSERDLVKASLNTIADAWVFEQDAGARPQSVQKTYLEEIERADVYIGIFWQGYGKHTIEEFEYAQKLGKPCFIYEKRIALEKRDPELQNFLNRINQVETGLTIQWFKKTKDLGEYIQRDILAWLTDLGRLGQAKSVHDVPLELLPHAGRFVGRENEIAKLQKDLVPGAIVTVIGPGGIGKTSLVAEILYRITSSGTKVPNVFSDGIISYSFYGKPEVNRALENILRRFDIEAKPTLEEAARILLANKRVLLVLDGAEEADDLDTIIDLRGRSCLLITSRSRGDVRQTFQNLEPLELEPSRALLQAWGREYINDHEAADQICSLLGGLPLALRLAGTYMFEHGELAREYLTWLKSTPLQALDHGARRDESVPILLTRSLDLVSSKSCKALGVVGLLALAPFAVGLVSIGMDVEQRTARMALGELIKFGLLRRSGREYEVSHALVHTYARRRISPPSQALERLLDSLGKQTHEVLESGLPENFRIFREHVRVVAQTAEIAGMEKGAGRLWNNLGLHLQEVAEYEGARIAFQRALKIFERVFGPDHPNLAVLLSNFGIVLHDMGDFHAAEKTYERAFQINKAAFGPNHPNIARDLNNLALTLWELGNYVEAQEAFERALEINEAILGPDDPIIAILLGNLGKVLVDLGEYDEAYDVFTKSLAIKEKVFGKNHPDTATTLNDIGGLLFKESDYSSALSYFQTASDIYEAVFGKDHPAVARVSNNLGMVYKTMGNYEKAQDAYKRALSIDETVFGPKHPSVASVLSNLGGIYHSLGNYKDALRVYKRSMTILEEILGSEHPDVATLLNNLGGVFKDMGEYHKAQEAYQRSLKIFRSHFPDIHPSVKAVEHNLSSLNK